MTQYVFERQFPDHFDMPAKITNHPEVVCEPGTPVKVLYGFDMAVGYFFTVLTLDEAEPVIVVDGMNNLNNGKMIALMNQFDVGSYEQRQAVGGDNPF